MGIWTRTYLTGASWSVQNLKIVSVPNGHTLARVHFGMKFSAVSAAEVAIQPLLNDFLAFGAVTQYSTVGATPPNALTSRGDVAPPAGRWLHWSAIGMTPKVMGSQHPDVMVWESEVSRETLDTQGQVKSAGGTGVTLDLYLTWAPVVTTGFAAHTFVAGHVWASALYI